MRSSAGALTDVRLYHYSKEPFVFDPSFTYTMRPDHFKPPGLWVSAEREGDDDFHGWRHWCEGESFRLAELAHRAEVVLHPDANMLIISTEHALRQFDAAFRNPGARYSLEELDWLRVMERYDGLIIAPYIWRCRMDLMWYYGWDCSSGVIWNLRAIESVERPDPPKDR